MVLSVLTIVLTPFEMIALSDSAWIFIKAFMKVYAELGAYVSAVRYEIFFQIYLFIF